MNYTIKELNHYSEFLDIIQLQDDIWKLKDRDKISLITIQTIAANYPSMGIVLGAYFDDLMVGFAIYMPTADINILYGVIMGILPKYEGSGLSIKILQKVNEISLYRGIKKICWTFEPLEPKLANLYINQLGAVVIKYKKDYYQIDDILNNTLPIDRFIVEYIVDEQKIKNDINPKLYILNEGLNYPIVNKEYLPNENKVLVKICPDINKLKIENYSLALNHRLGTRYIFEEYINKRGYIINRFYTEKRKGERTNFYLLEK